jgi:diguanylate cyclase (GGDEF)-like protein
MKLGLRARIVFIASAGIVFAVAAITFAAGLDLSTNYEHAMQSRSAAIGKGVRIQLERLLQYGIKLDELSGFDEQCREAVAAFEGTSSAFVVSPDGKIAFHSTPGRAGQPLRDKALLAAVALPQPAVVKASDQGQAVYASVEPVENRGGERLGSVVVTFPASHIGDKISELAMYGLLVGLGVLAIGILALYGAISKFVTRPLSLLLDTVHKIRSGKADFTVRAQSHGTGEIGMLIDGFNGMLDHIQQRDAQLVSMEKLARSEASLAYAQRLARVGNWEWNVENDQTYFSPEIYRLLDLEPAARVESFQMLLDRVPEEDREQVKAAFLTLLKQGGSHSLEHRIIAHDGTEHVVFQQWEAVHQGEGRARLARGTMQDITERKQIERQMRMLAYYDSLTGLPNRVLFKEQLARALRKAARESSVLAVMFLDLDRFKQINDTLGHPVGDLLLKEVGARLRQCLRPEDDVGRDDPDNMARMGGDEFTVMLSGLARPEDAGKVAQRVVDELARPFSIEGHELFVSTSLGIAAFPADGSDVDALLKNADIAMYSAKERGRNNFQFYSKDLNQRAFERLALERDLHRALARNEFYLDYQPLVEAPSRVIGVEALLRWRHPERGLVSPATFIPVAEQCGLIVPIGNWVLGEACRQGKAWCDAGHTLEVSVNVSGIQFRDGSLVPAVKAALRTSGFDARLLIVEATETIVMQNVKSTMSILDELKSLGIRIALDDFGTGYSSLSYLKRFPLDTLKIDASFVRDIETSNGDNAIVSAIIAMATSLRLRTLAEGVETARQVEILVSLGCTRMQGYYFSRPVAPQTVPALLSRLAAGHAPAGANREPGELESVT